MIDKHLKSIKSSISAGLRRGGQSCALFASLCVFSTTYSSTTIADTNSHWVDVIYVVPSDSPNRGQAQQRAQILVQAMQMVQRQWAGWGFSWRLDTNVTIDYSSQPCSYYDNFASGNDNVNMPERILNDIRGAFGLPDNIVRNIFVDCSNVKGAAAVGGQWSTQYYGGVVNDIINEVTNNLPIKSAVGAIGHEMGHSFHMPHENCNGNEAPNADYLRKIGLPDYGTKSLMCNGGNWPNVNAPEPWMRDTMNSRGGCNWFNECSGGGNPVQIPDASSGGSEVKTAAGLCIDVSGANVNNGANIQQWGCNGSSAQKFSAVPSGNGFMLRSDRSGKCLDVEGVSTETGANVHQWDCLGGANQVFTRQGSSLVFQHSGKCLDISGGSSDSGANIQQWDCNGSPAQNFTGNPLGAASTNVSAPVPVNNTAPVATGSNEIRTDAGLCVDVSGASTANGASIQQWSCNGSGAQRFSVETSNGGFRIRNQNSGKCLDVESGSTGTGANVHQWDCLNIASQTLSRQGNSLVFQHSGKCLDISGGSRDSGANIQQWDCNGSGAQQFSGNFSPTFSNLAPSQVSTTPSSVPAISAPVQTPVSTSQCSYLVTNNSDQRVNFIEYYGRGLVQHGYLSAGASKRVTSHGEFIPSIGSFQFYTNGDWINGDYSDSITAGNCGSTIAYVDPNAALNPVSQGDKAITDKERTVGELINVNLPSVNTGANTAFPSVNSEVNKTEVDKTEVVSNKKVDEPLLTETFVSDWSALEASKYISKSSSLRKLKGRYRWQAQANSTRFSTYGFTDNYRLSFQLSRVSSGTMLGLGVEESSASYEDIDYAFHLKRGYVEIYENGVQQDGQQYEIKSGDVFSFEVNNGTLSYLLNDLVLRTVAYSGEPDFYIDSSFDRGGFKIRKVKLSPM